MTKLTKIPYVKPQMKTVVTPKEVRDIEQPCAFNEPQNKPNTER